MRDLPQRKPLRLKGYDYSQEGMYFITACAQNGLPVFGRVVGGGVLDAPLVALTDAGTAVDRRIRAINEYYDDVQVEKYVITPNHLHLLVRIIEAPGGPSRTPAPTGVGNHRANETIPWLVSTLKRLTDRECGRPLWQDGYYDHIVRDEHDFLRVWTYLDENPAKWAEDRYYVKG